MSSDLKIKNAKIAFLTNFQHHPAQGDELMGLVDDLVASNRIVSGSLDSLIELDNDLQAPVEGQISNLPKGLDARTTVAIMAYVRERYGIVISDEWGVENSDPEILLTELVPEGADVSGEEVAVAREEASAVRQEPPIPGPEPKEVAEDEILEADEADEDYDAGAFDNVNVMPDFADAQPRTAKPSRDQDPALKAHWEKRLRPGLEKCYDEIYRLSMEKRQAEAAGADQGTLDGLQLEIDLIWADLCEREWFMKRMARRNHPMSRNFARGLELIQARVDEENFNDPQTYRRRFFD